MTAVAERAVGQLPAPSRRALFRPPRWLLGLTAAAMVNGTLFMIIRPGVNDLWAARARASAVAHGVNLTYWFSWFGGGSTPGNYSVLTPYLCALLSAELVGALAALALTPLCAALLRGTRNPVAATGVATLAAGVNLWSGRVPFLLGSAFAVAALIEVRKKRRLRAGLATVLSIAASPVSGAFLALGLAGAFLVTRSHRAVSASTMATVVVSLGLVGLAFGNPGPQPFPWTLLAEAAGALALFLLARPADYLRAIIWLSMLTALVLAVIPNGLGANFGRMLWFCLPVAVVATSARRVWLALLLVAPVVLGGANLTVTDLRDSRQPVAEVSYYLPLANELDKLSGLDNHRLEVVAEGAHAAYDALLDHAMLARGWETQEDNALNKTLLSPTLDDTAYKIWLDNNSVGYVALPRSRAEVYPEYTLVASGSVPYLTQVWSDSSWRLFRVTDPTPIVAAPQQILQSGQSQMTIRVTCACTFSVRVRYSRYLRADPLRSQGQGAALVTDDGYGFTRLTTMAPGDYVLHGSVTSLFLH